MTDSLLAELITKPVGPTITPRIAGSDDFTTKIEVNPDRVTATIRGPEGQVDESTGAEFLRHEGLNPDEWEVTGFRKVQYGSTSEPMESVAFTYRRKHSLAAFALDIDELLSRVELYETPEINRASGPYGFVVPIGDMQFGKIDGDGAAGTIIRTVAAIHSAARRFLEYSNLFSLGHIHVAWLGDHIEGFNSQGGANAWRTQLTLNEQIRLTRRVMLEAMLAFAPLAERVTMAAVPGNHGEPVRFEGHGLTRYDDSHDTESLIAVADVIALMPEKFGHVECYVPHTDELIVMTEVAGTKIAHHHGHKWRPGKHWEWWSDQAFNPESPMHMADVLLAGHLHHDQYEVNGLRTYWGQPAMESESTWFRHMRGVGGAPTSNVGIVYDGRVIVRDSHYL